MRKQAKTCRNGRGRFLTAGVAAAGPEGQAFFDRPQPTPKPPNAGKHSRTEAGIAHPAEGSRTLSALLTNNSRTQAKRQPRKGTAEFAAQNRFLLPGAAFSFAVSKENVAQFLCMKCKKSKTLWVKPDWNKRSEAHWIRESIIPPRSAG